MKKSPKVVLFNDSGEKKFRWALKNSPKGFLVEFWSHWFAFLASFCFYLKMMPLKFFLCVCHHYPDFPIFHFSFAACFFFGTKKRFHFENS